MPAKHPHGERVNSSPTRADGALGDAPQKPARAVSHEPQRALQRGADDLHAQKRYRGQRQHQDQRQQIGADQPAAEIEQHFQEKHRRHRPRQGNRRDAGEHPGNERRPFAGIGLRKIAGEQERNDGNGRDKDVQDRPAGIQAAEPGRIQHRIRDQQQQIIEAVPGIYRTWSESAIGGLSNGASHQAGRGVAPGIQYRRSEGGTNHPTDLSFEDTPSAPDLRAR